MGTWYASRHCDDFSFTLKVEVLEDDEKKLLDQNTGLGRSTCLSAPGSRKIKVRGPGTGQRYT